jgi:hypothetical protein
MNQLELINLPQQGLRAAPRQKRGLAAPRCQPRSPYSPRYAAAACGSAPPMGLQGLTAFPCSSPQWLEGCVTSTQPKMKGKEKC